MGATGQKNKADYSGWGCGGAGKVGKTQKVFLVLASPPQKKPEPNHQP